MKKKLLLPLLLLLLGLLDPGTGQAQITAVHIDTGYSLRHRLDRPCIPVTQRTSFFGYVTGTHGPSDSLLVRLDYGDGSSEHYKIPILVPGDSFFSNRSVHTYTTAGSYVTRLVIVAPGGVSDTMWSKPTVATDTCISSTKLYVTGSDSLPVHCKLPYLYGLFCWGSISGLPLAGDSAFLHVNFGDGSDTTVKVKVTSGGSSTSYYNASLSHTYTLSGFFEPVVTVLTKSGAADTTTATSFTLNDSCANLKGKVYLDANGNCLADAGEKGFHWIPVITVNTLTGDTLWTYSWTDTAGQYAIELPAGNYKITPIVNYYSVPWGISGGLFTPSCPASGSATLAVTASGTYTQDFAYECSSISSFDAHIHASATCFVAGDTTLISLWSGYWYSMYHLSCLNIPATISLSLDPKLSYAGHVDGSAPTSVSGATISWTLSGSSVSNFNSRILALVAPTATLSDTLSITANVTLTGAVTDPNSSNNTFVYTRGVRSSYDPNMKEAAPSGQGNTGLIAPNTPMTYTIHFQNTGTAAARNITITDQLDKHLDPASFHMLSSTHAVDVYREGTALKFRFNGINLPDSGSNYFGSMGSITYAILPVRDLAPRSEIRNTAAIYFDYNEPIITNTTLNTIQDPASIQVIKAGTLEAQVYPNPAGEKVQITLNTAGNYTLQLSDLSGRTLLSQSFNGKQSNLSLAGLPSGMYLLSISSQDGNRLNTRLVVRQ